MWRPVEAECKTILEAMSWVEQAGYVHVIFETDAKQVVDAINSSNADRTELGEMVEACRAIMARNPGFEAMFSRREKNKVAHLIARHSIMLSSPFVGSDVPDWLVNALTEQCTETHEQ
ncbi:hypothetical protein LINPERHAP2_LOCUS5224 [Linum perenne]